MPKSKENVQEAISLSATYTMVLNRICICILAVLLVWITTLRSATDITELFVSSPGFSHVSDTCYNSWQYVESQRQEYQGCASRQIARCGVQLDAASSVEQGRVDKIIERNDKIIHEMMRQNKDCSSMWEGLRDSVKKYSEASQASLVYRDPLCSQNEVTLSKELLDDKRAASEDETSHLVEYSRRSDGAVSRLVHYASALQAYNVAYVRNRTFALGHLSRITVANIALLSLPEVDLGLQQLTLPIEALRMCSAGGAVGASCALDPLVSASRLYEDALSLVKLQINAAERTYNEVMQEAKSFSEAVTEALANADAFYDAMLGVSGAVQWLQHHLDVFDLGSFCESTNPNPCRFDKGDWVVPALELKPLPHIGELPDTSVLWAELADTLGSVNNAVKATADEVSQRVSSMVSEIDTTLALNVTLAPEDYRPPRYASASGEPSDEETRQKRDSEEFRANATTAFKEESSEFNATNAFRTYVVLPAHSLSTALRSTFTSEWAAFNPGGVDLSEWMTAFTSIQSGLYIFDYAYRIVKTLHILRRHWSHSVGRTPPVDLRATKPAFPFGEQLRVATTYFSYIGVQLVLLVVICGFILYSLTVVYTKSYYSYSDACVHGTRNSTYIMRNVNSLAFNYASMGSNRDIADGITSYNAQSQETCANAQVTSQRLYDEHYHTMFSLNRTFHENAAKVRLIDTCLDHSSIDAYYASSCCSLSAEHQAAEGACAGQPEGPPETVCPGGGDGSQVHPPMYYLGAAACSLENWPLKAIHIHNFTNAAAEGGGGEVPAGMADSSPIFDCARLPQCTVSCAGPDRSVIAAASQSCSCMLEWYIHAHLLKSLIVTAVYVVLNLSRAFICRGLLQALRPQLAVDVFECQLCCTGSGTLLSENGEILQLETGKVMNPGKGTEPLAEAVRSAARRHSAIGVAMVIIGLLLNALWAWFLPQISDGLEYVPHEQAVEY